VSSIVRHANDVLKFGREGAMDPREHHFVHQEPILRRCSDRGEDVVGKGVAAEGLQDLVAPPRILSGVRRENVGDGCSDAGEGRRLGVKRGAKGQGWDGRGLESVGAVTSGHRRTIRDTLASEATVGLGVLALDGVDNRLFLLKGTSGVLGPLASRRNSSTGCSEDGCSVIRRGRSTHCRGDSGRLAVDRRANGATGKNQGQQQGVVVAEHGGLGRAKKGDRRGTGTGKAGPGRTRQRRRRRKRRRRRGRGRRCSGVGGGQAWRQRCGRRGLCAGGAGAAGGRWRHGAPGHEGQPGGWWRGRRGPAGSGGGRRRRGMSGHGGRRRGVPDQSRAALGRRGRGQRSPVGERERREELAGGGERGPASHGTAAAGTVKALVPCENVCSYRNPSYSTSVLMGQAHVHISVTVYNYITI
jgi:hypothetical protein